CCFDLSAAVAIVAIVLTRLKLVGYNGLLFKILGRGDCGFRTTSGIRFIAAIANPGWAARIRT
ncbi:MAG TPA: hypothetical protein VN679_11150, partial [Candidatus Acidoferrales bacterium]|nr:hypothetical protein [Candidatus Acidoferrales bacterium]